MTGGARLGLGIVVREWHSVKRHDFKCLSVKLQVQVAVRRGIHDAPELSFFRRDLDSWANCPIHGKNFFDCLRFSSTSLRRDVNLAPEFGCILVMLNRAAAQDNHTLTESPYLGGIPFHSLDDDGS